MNVLQTRMNNTSHMLFSQRGGGANRNESYKKGDRLRVREDVDLNVDESLVSVPKGTLATVEDFDMNNLNLDLGEGLGMFTIGLREVGKFFERDTFVEGDKEDPEGSSLTESNPTIATPGAYVEVTGYDPNIGPNRGPDSPGHGGYQTLVGQRGQIATLFGLINGIKTYKVKLVYGGEQVLGETEFQVVGRGIGTYESVNEELDLGALRGLGLGLGY